MALTYTTLTVMGPTVSAFLNGEVLSAFPFPVFVAQTDIVGCIVLYPETLRDVPNVGDFAAISVSLLRKDAVAVLAVVDGEDTLTLRFFRGGTPVDTYHTEPGRASGDELPPSVGNVERISELFGIDDAATLSELADVLRATRYDDQFGFGESKERHGEIADLLGLPSASVGTGYESIQRGLLPEGVSIEELTHYPSQTQYEIKLRQFALFCPKIGESDAEIASRFLPDVISWEDDFLGEPLPSLGTMESLQSHVSEFLPEYKDRAGAIVDFEYGALEGVVMHAMLFTRSGEDQGSLFARLCCGKPWAVWGYESRQTVYRSDATSE